MQLLLYYLNIEELVTVVTVPIITVCADAQAFVLNNEKAVTVVIVSLGT